LSQLSAERVRTELMKLFVAPGAIDAVETMLNYGLLVEILGAVPLLTRFKRVSDIEARLGEAPDPVRRLGALAVLKPEDAARLTGHLRLSNEDRSRLAAMAQFLPAQILLDGDVAARRALYRLGGERWHDAIFAAWVAANGQHLEFRRRYDLPARWPVPVNPVKGADLLSRGVSAGPQIGEALRRLERMWIDSDFTLSREQLLALL
jgi:tRNA nucleotidyltransferase/poly(A) polymerase